MQSIRIAPTRLGLAAALVLLAAAPAAAQPVPTGRQVLDRYVEAVGGRAALQRVQSRHSVYEMSMSGITMTMDIKMARPNRARVAMITPVGEVLSGYDGTVAWVSSVMTGPQLLEGPEAALAIRKAGFDQDFLFDAYTSFETLGREEIDGRSCWNVKMTAEDGDEMTRCFSTETGLQVGATEGGNTLVYGEYQEIDGLKYPAVMTSAVEGQQVTLTLKSVSHAPIAAEVFALPAEVQALKN